MDVGNAQLVFHVVFLPILTGAANQKILADDIHDAQFPGLVVFLGFRIALKEQLRISLFQQRRNIVSEKRIDFLEFRFLRAHGCEKCEHTAFSNKQFKNSP